MCFPSCPESRQKSGFKLFMDMNNKKFLNWLIKNEYLQTAWLYWKAPPLIKDLSSLTTTTNTIFYLLLFPQSETVKKTFFRERHVILIGRAIKALQPPPPPPGLDGIMNFFLKIT